MPLICAFHANVDRSDAISIRQRYAQDFPFPPSLGNMVTIRTSHTPILFLQECFLILCFMLFINFRYYSLEGYVKEAALFSPLLIYIVHRSNT
jgi:hypothetical protein